MDEKINLPIVNEEGCYEIRLESIGGLGANLCGKLLGELGASYLGLNASSFSSYGSEKRGSPVKAFIAGVRRTGKSASAVRWKSPISWASFTKPSRGNCRSQPVFWRRRKL